MSLNRVSSRVAMTSLVVAIMAIQGCASTPEPTYKWTPRVEMEGIDQAKYEKDLAVCQEIADEAVIENDKMTKPKKGVTNTAMTIFSGGANIIGRNMAMGSISNAVYKGELAGCLTKKGYTVLN